MCSSDLWPQPSLSALSSHLSPPPPLPSPSRPRLGLRPHPHSEPEARRGRAPPHHIDPPANPTHPSPTHPGRPRHQLQEGALHHGVQGAQRVRRARRVRRAAALPRAWPLGTEDTHGWRGAPEEGGRPARSGPLRGGEAAGRLWSAWGGAKRRLPRAWVAPTPVAPTLAPPPSPPRHSPPGGRARRSHLDSRRLPQLKRGVVGGVGGAVVRAVRVQVRVPLQSAVPLQHAVRRVPCVLCRPPCSDRMCTCGVLRGKSAWARPSRACSMHTSSARPPPQPSLAHAGTRASCCLEPIPPLATQARTSSSPRAPPCRSRPRAA